MRLERGALVLPKIQVLRRDLLTVRRAIWPMREAGGRASGGGRSPR